MKEINPFEALEKIPYPLTVVTAGDPERPGKRGGMAVAWLTRVSWSPPLVALSVAPGRYTYQLIKEYKAFAVHVVSKSMEKLAIDVFGGMSGKNVDKFKVAGVEPVKARAITAPIIPVAPIIMECKLVGEYVVGDHVMLIGEVVKAYKGEEMPPLIYLEGYAVEASTL